ncbi:phospholipid-transporting ATPase IK-like isoform X3 [Hylaeus volcanicus]|uniref:phospholipid-transporting ATPase IK-like isoform X3 n=1 Tax=Hylaeus volcanicus TaxID=313075 RepID=UPI0023B83002|nr:phospholipid-transporting ATPase IK-like isoform X3 [Hylaeus volcanicus]
MNVIYINTNQKNAKKINAVCTRKYSSRTFLPHIAREHFSDSFTLYCVGIGILQMIPSVFSQIKHYCIKVFIKLFHQIITVTYSIPTMWIPWLQIVLLVIYFEMYADIKRHGQDEKENFRQTRKLRYTLHDTVDLKKEGLKKKSTTVVSIVYWKDVSVGDVIICKNSEIIPADLCLIASSHADGCAMFDSSSLDGECELKRRRVPSEIIEHGFGTAETVHELCGKLICDPPNVNLNVFNGVYIITKSVSDEIHKEEGNLIQFPFNLENSAFRGYKLCNTHWIAGVVIYAGEDTKVYKSHPGLDSKMSINDIQYKKYCETSLVFLVSVCLLYTLSWIYVNIDLDSADKPFFLVLSFLKKALYHFGSWIVLTANFVPVSVYAFLNCIRQGQAFIMERNFDSPNPPERKHVIVNNHKLNSDLGQVEYIFADKTGTLTQNSMELKCLCISGVDYQSTLPKLTNVPHVSVHNADLSRNIAEMNRDIWDFFTQLAVNHSVVINQCLLNSGLVPHTSIFTSSSADEEVLVYTALNFGFVFMKELNSQRYIARPDGSCITINVLECLNFTPERRRSSVLVQWKENSETTSTSRIVLFIKGSQESIYKRLKKEERYDLITENTLRHSLRYATEGLRVFFFAERIIPQSFLDVWLCKYRKAKEESDVTTVDELVENLECELHLLGCVGMENKLVDNVCEAVAQLKAAGIKIFMLTGDKLETATNIGFQTGILSKCKPLIYLDDAETIYNQIRNFFLINPLLKNFFDNPVKLSPTVLRNAFTKHDTNFVIDCMAINHILETDSLLLAGLLCVSEALRNYYRNEVITLSIGDGANDCMMINSSNIGVGLPNVNGYYTFSVLDYGLSSFCDLPSLILVHGRMNYYRIIKFIMHSISQIIIITLPQLAVGYVSLLSPQKMVSTTLYLLATPLFSSLPLLLFALFDCATTNKHEQNCPQKYMQNYFYFEKNSKYFIFFFLDSILSGFLAFIIPFTIMDSIFVDRNGRPTNFWIVGTTSFSCSLLITTQKLTFKCTSSFGLVFITSIISFILFFPLILYFPGLQETGADMLQLPTFWISLATSFFLTIFKDYFIKVYNKHHKTDLINLIYKKIPLHNYYHVEQA